jgi:hypothetical protein
MADTSNRVDVTWQRAANPLDGQLDFSSSDEDAPQLAAAELHRQHTRKSEATACLHGAALHRYVFDSKPRQLRLQCKGDMRVQMRLYECEGDARKARIDHLEAPGTGGGGVVDEDAAVAVADTVFVPSPPHAATTSTNAATGKFYVMLARTSVWPAPSS